MKFNKCLHQNAGPRFFPRKNTGFHLLLVVKSIKTIIKIQKNQLFQLFCMKKVERFNYRFECAAPKRWLKYTTHFLPTTPTYNLKSY